MSGNENDNKIVDSGRVSQPAEGTEEFMDRPPHLRNKPDSWANPDGTKISAEQ